MEPLKNLFFLLMATGTSASSLGNVLAAHNNTLSVLNNFLAGQEELFEALSTAKDITVLAPSNDALNKLADDDAVMNAMASEEGMVAAFLKYHVFNGTYFTSNFSTDAGSPTIVPTLMNDTSYTNITGGQKVQAMSSGGGITFVSGNQHHASMQSGDYNYTGGTIHIIDSVLYLPSNISDTLTAANLTAAAGAFNTAGLADDINQESEITVFAPSNEGFNTVGSAVSGLTAAQLAALMGYHVIRGKVLYTAMMANNSSETTSEGNRVHIRVEDGGQVFVNSARIIRSNLFAANGVVHVCDNVLNPSNEHATPDPSLPTQSPAFSNAQTTNSVPFTSGVPTPTPTALATATVTAVAGGGGGGGDAPATALAAPKLLGGGTGVMGAMVVFAGAVVGWNW